MHVQPVNGNQPICSQARLGADHTSAITLQVMGPERHRSHRFRADNADRIQHMREVAVVNQKANTEKRKTDWDNKAQFCQFEKGDRVYLRKSGLNTKLEDIHCA